MNRVRRPEILDVMDFPSLILTQFASCRGSGEMWYAPRCVAPAPPANSGSIPVLTPLAPGAWKYATAAHLLNRAAFGGTPDEIEGARAKDIRRRWSTSR